jgi:hypothetical protein
MPRSLATGSIPLPLKRRARATVDLVQLEIARVRYHVGRARRLPLETQVRSLPQPRRPVIWWTELDNIGLHAPFATFPRARSGPWTVEGDWDLERVQPRPTVFAEASETTVARVAHETVRTMFLEGRDHRETPQYELMIRTMEVQRQGSARGCRTVEEVDAYFDRLRAAFASMRQHGYLTQRELGRSGRDEMQLYATRDGRLCKRGGANHRILMAEVLGIRWVPFTLSGLHPYWVMELVERVRTPPHRAINVWPSHDEAIEDVHPSAPSRPS